MSRTLQFRRLSANTLANTTGAAGELIINTNNYTLTVHDGALPGGYALLNSQTDNNIDQTARNTANSATTLAQNAYNYANTIVSDTQIDPVARATANSAAANTILIQGVNLTQNTNITNATNLAQAAYDYANTITTTDYSNTNVALYLANYDGTINFTASPATITGVGTMSTTELIAATRIVSPTTNLIFDRANSAITLAQNAYNAANAANGGGVTGNISIASTNSAINFVANSSGDGYGFSTLELIPDTNASLDQYIVIDPTAPNHIHLRAGGAQDASQAELFLGGEKNYVRINDNQGLRLQNQYTNDNYNYYSENSQYTSGIWYEESGNYFIQFTTDDLQMVDDLNDFASGNILNEIILYWDPGTGVISNTMISVANYWQGIGNVYTAQVNSTLPANNTILTAIEFHLFTTQTNYLQLQSNDFIVDVQDDIRINGRDTFSLRNWSTNDPIQIVTRYDDLDYTWRFNADATLEVPGAVNFQQNATIPLAAPAANGVNDRITLWDFDGAGSGFNYAIGAEGNHIWFTMDVNNGTGGFKFYSRDNQIFKIRDDGALIFSDTSVQDSASISIVALKALVANCATYTDFQTAIANL